MRVKAGAVAAFALMMATSAKAETYRFSATGILGSPSSVDRNFNPVANFPTSITSNDNSTIEFEINPVKFLVTPLYDADPAINIYWGTASSYELTIGAYKSVVVGDVTFSSIQLWNDFVSAGSPVDAFSISVLQQIPEYSAPITLTSSSINQVFGFSAFDFSTLARTNDLINQITPLNGFSSQSAFFGFIDPVTYDQTTYSINGLSATITPIPELQTWLMLLMGFSVVGATLRSSRKIRLTSPLRS